ncbi:unnamed protein product [Closterium sp. Yama58-4]|nr:unnamed protein product [Closterium sp. Yama58-4]
MPRVVKKGSKPAAQAKGPDALDLAAKGHQSEPATPKPHLKEVEGPFGDGVRASLVKRLSALKFPSSDAPPDGKDTSTNEKEDREEEVKSPTAAPEAPEEGTEDEEEEDDGYLSDDPEERFDPVKAGEIAARAGFSITLLVPIKYEEEVPRTIDTVKGLLAIWRKFMSAHVLVTTKCQAVGALIESADDFVASYLSSCIPAARCAGEEDLTRPCCGADLHGGKPGGMALRPGGMWQGAWFQFYAGAGACEVGAALHGAPAGRRGKQEEEREDEFSSDPQGVRADPDLDKSSRSGSGNENQRLLGFWRTEDLRDAFRVLHPNRPEYTFRDRATKASTRIDRGLVSFSLLGLLADARHVKIPRGLSDHWFGIKLALAVAAPAEQGPGIWRMQARQARGSGVSTVSANILKKFENEEGMDLGKKLKLLSMGLREYSREERKRVRATVQHLEGVVERLRHKVMRYPEDRRAQNKLIKKEAHLEAYLQSCKDRMQVLAGIKVELSGEVPSPYLSAKIKVRKKRTEVRVISHRGAMYQGPKEVLKAAADHFRSAFSEVVPEEEVDWGAFSEGAKFSEADAELLGAVWTEEEVKQALESLPKGKSPGQDGLPAEFFIAHWELLKKHVMDFVGEFAEKAKMPESLSTSVTVLLHKKGPTDQLGNYRPITLLSAMYKVITKVMATRLKKVLGKVLSKEQHGFLPGKSLADAVSVVADAVEAANSGGEDWLLLLVDFQKAYDTVSRSFLFRFMKELGMPENFIGWTRGLHADAGTRIIINGWLSDRVEMCRGVRQGCPLAPYIFLCALEPLCRATQREGLGIGPVGKEPLAYVGYADDTSFLLSGEAQLRRTVEVLDTFGKQSGLKVNCDKSVVVPLGSNRGEPVPADIPYKWSVQGEPERLLGVWVTPNGDPGPSWGMAYERIKEELRKWEAQYLTTTARVAVISCYVLPVLMFQAQVYSPPDEIWEKIRKLCHAFVSAGEAAEEKIFILWSAYLACLPRKDGGLGQLDPKLCLDGLAIRRIGKFLKEPDGTRRWLAEKAAALPQGLATLYAHPSAMKHWPRGSERWKAAVKVFWSSPLETLPAPKNRWEVEEEFICFNRNIMHWGESPYGHQIGTAALIITRVRDLLTDGPGGRRGVKEEDELVIELGSKEAAVMARKAYGAMPPEWRKLIEEPATAEAVAKASGVVRYVLRG